MIRSVLLACVFALLAVPAAGADYERVPGGAFRSVLAQEGGARTLEVAAFRMRALPVTNAEFLAFVQRQPRWRRDRVAALFATPGYLSRWSGPLALGAGAPARQPVTRVSWFAARAYCASEGARLPRWIEWEYAAAADAQRRDARADAAWRAQALARLTAAFGAPPAEAGRDAPNVYGLHDMRTLVWEWVDDYAALFVNTDARQPGEASLLGLCGGAALAFADRDDYALLMRVAALAALAPADGADNVGFRCVRDIEGAEHP
ncbi:MAG: formylglycine-generating enzyme family protein [Mizugakiibacter sp.]|uniref:formylglycine-generating enzyme family protein n=1 Tax=Mizugakiibacter sp. TaxID=1972610 RepID=UPI0031BF6A42|nr:formylglycine-generating enzyme family protein [Xanthomonadaceae bacterium]